jgi:hypothetical protein
MIVRKLKDGIGYERVAGEIDAERIVDTAILTYHDGRRTEIDVDPYPVTERLDVGKVDRLAADGTWGDDELGAYGLAVASPFVVPEGKRAIGEPAYIAAPDGTVAEVFEVEDLPPPPPDLTVDEKVDAMLAAHGLTRDDFRKAIAETDAGEAVKR